MSLKAIVGLCNLNFYVASYCLFSTLALDRKLVVTSVIKLKRREKVFGSIPIDSCVFCLLVCFF